MKFSGTPLPWTASKNRRPDSRKNEPARRRPASRFHLVGRQYCQQTEEASCKSAGRVIGAHPLNDMNYFTPRAQQVLALARKEADRLSHNTAGTEHLLLGMIKLGQGVAVNVLQKMGFDLETVRMEVEKQVVRGSGKMLRTAPYSPGVKKVLALAGKEAKSLSHSHVGTEHILLGILRESGGVAARALKSLGVDIERTRNEIRSELDPNFAPGEQDGARREPNAPSGLHGGMEPIQGFAPRAQQVLALARKEADRFSHKSVGPEHLLLGIIKLGTGIAVNVLQKMGLDLETVRVEVEKQVGSDPETTMAGNSPYTSSAKKVLALSGREAKSLCHSYVGSEHILLGLVREGESVAAHVLKEHGADMERTRNATLKELDPNFSPGAENNPRQKPIARSWLRKWWPPWKQ